MKKKIVLAVVLVASMGAAHAQQGTENSLMQAWNKMNQMTTTASTTKSAYDNMIAQVSVAIEAVKKAIGNINDPVAREDAIAKVKSAAQAIKDLITGTITSNTTQSTAQSKFGTASLDEAREMLQQ